VERDFALWAFVFMSEHVYLIVCPRRLVYTVSQILQPGVSPQGVGLRALSPASHRRLGEHHLCSHSPRTTGLPKNHRRPRDSRTAAPSLERELRQGMARAGEESLPPYPVGRPCARPTTHREIEVFSSIQRHEVRVGDGEPEVMVTKLTKLQRTIIWLLGLDPRTYGLA
jgi:hypothetical protein